MNKVYDVECLEMRIYDLYDAKKRVNINQMLNDRLETILYGMEDEGRTATIKSVIPMYEDGELLHLLVLFEHETQIGVLFNGREDVEFYPKEFIGIFKEGKEIILDESTYKIKNIRYDLDRIYLLLRIELEEP